MGLFGSLYTSASGMTAASRGTQGVSENVANISTIGYKRKDTAFADLVAGNKSNTNNNKAGAVGATQITRATLQGQVQQTSSSLDASISGNGFFPVSKDLLGEEFAYTRNGQFSTFAVRTTADTDPLVAENTGEGTYLRNSAGFYLYGWPIDVDGNVASGADTASLQPIEVGIFQTQALATTTIDLSINLDAGEQDYNPQLLGQQLPVNNQDLHFSRSVNVFDANGDEHPVTFEYRKISGPMAQFTSNVNTQLSTTDAIVDPLGNTSGILNGDTLDITDGTDTLSVTFVNAPADTSLNEAATISDLRTVINSFTDVNGSQIFEASLGQNGQFMVRSVNPSSSLDISASSATVLGATGFNIATDPVDGDYAYDPDFDVSAAPDPLGPYPNQADFPALANVTNPNPYGWWEVSVMIPDPANPTSGNTVVQSQGLMNFDGRGSLNAAAGTETITLPAIDFDSGGTGDELSLTVNVGNTSQFAGNYNVIQAEQNGAPLGQRTGVSIGNDGIVRTQYSNGAEIEIYQIPLAMFANPEGLQAESGTVFTETENSGAVTLTNPEANGAGKVNSATLENSNVDIGNEMSYLIVFQRTFGMNSQVINAVDEMTQNLAQLKR